MIHLLLKGILAGFAVAAPVGPVGLLCIRRSIIDGRLAGFVTGLGAAVADAGLALIAGLGVTAIINFVAGHQNAFHLGGGLVLVTMGVLAMRARPPCKAEGPVHAGTIAKAFFSTIALTLANPMTIAAMLLLFSSFGVSLNSAGGWDPVVLVMGVFTGSTLWWLILSTFAEWFGRRLNTRLLRTINIATGILLAGFGVYQMATPWL
jgi:threonine/homoserine/homoserine lactone efflux protein